METVVDPLDAGLIDLLESNGKVEGPPDILKRLEKRDLALVMSRGHRLHLTSKEILFFQGDRHKGIFIIQSGLVRTYYTSTSGREITLAYWQPGNFVGGPDVFGESIHMWSGVAVRDTDVVMLPGSEIRGLMERIPEFAVALVEALVFKGKRFSTLVQLLGTRSIAERLSHLLLALSSFYGVSKEGGIAIAADFTHEDLAHMVGASRQWVTTTLDRLQEKGVVRIRKRQVIILRPDLLSPVSRASSS
ncbi:MAG: Crp/Fnr family transcriptional regulator [Gammaproteobacteria bacterium]|nr:Crp/Fnr family transcriptional regulator [Gammaproteobacteria bacterium]